MMKTKLFIIGALSAAVFVSCQDEPAATESIDQERIEVNQEEEHSDEASIALNDGEKWEVNKEMLPHIEKSEEVFNNFEGDDYAALSEEMMKHTNNLIQSCTMEGASHDELHKWLHPHIELIKKLKAIDSQDDAEEVIEDIETSFEVFHHYFK